MTCPAATRIGQRPRRGRPAVTGRSLAAVIGAAGGPPGAAIGPLGRYLIDPGAVTAHVARVLLEAVRHQGPVAGPLLAAALIRALLGRAWLRRRQHAAFAADARVITVLAPPLADPAGGEALWGNLGGLLRPRVGAAVAWAAAYRVRVHLGGPGDDDRGVGPRDGAARHGRAGHRGRLARRPRRHHPRHPAPPRRCAGDRGDAAAGPHRGSPPQNRSRQRSAAGPRRRRQRPDRRGARHRPGPHPPGHRRPAPPGPPRRPAAAHRPSRPPPEHGPAGPRGRPAAPGRPDPRRLPRGRAAGRGLSRPGAGR